MNNDLAPDELAARYQLLCRSTQAEAAKDPQAQQVEMHFQALNQLLQHDLRALARRGSPDDVADIYFALEQELERFREFCSFPALAEKFLVAFGGGFSAGKSSLINTLLGKRLLAIEVDPTTSLPTYLLKGEHDAIHAHNLFGHRIDLSTEEFLSLTHDEIERYGSNISRLLRSVVITRADFPWSNLALIDTPGYTKHEDQTQGARTDESIARTQLNAAQAIVWVIDARQGCITENDLQFLASVQADIPRLIVVSRADQKPTEEINAIVQGIKATLSEHDLPFVDVIPVSAHQKQEWSIEPIRTQLAAWSRQPRALRFAQNLKAQFTRYANFIEEEESQMQRHLNRLNRILVLTESQDVQADAAELKWQAEYSLTAAKDSATELLGLSRRFFSKIKAIADVVGIARSQLLENNEYPNTVLREAAPPLDSSINPAPFTVEYSYFNYTGSTLILSLRNGLRLKIESGNSVTSSGFTIKVVYKFSQYAAERLCTFLANRNCPADDPLYPFKEGLLTRPYKQGNRFIVSVDYPIAKKEFGMKGGAIYVSDADILLTMVDSIERAFSHPYSEDIETVHSGEKDYFCMSRSESMKYLPVIILGIGTAQAAVSVVTAVPQQAGAYEAPLHWRSPPKQQVDVALREVEAAAVTESIVLNAENLPVVYATEGLFPQMLLLDHALQYKSGARSTGATSRGGVAYDVVIRTENDTPAETYEWLSMSRTFEQLGQRIRMVLENSVDKFRLSGEQARALDAELTRRFNRILHRQLSVPAEVYIESFVNDIDSLLQLFNESPLYKMTLPGLRLAERDFIINNTFILSGEFRDCALSDLEEMRLPAFELSETIKPTIVVQGVPTITVLLRISADEMSIDIDVGQTKALIASEHRQLATLASTIVDMVNPITNTRSNVTLITLDRYVFELDKGLLGDHYYLVTRTR